MVKHFCDRCNKFLHKTEICKITLSYTHEFCSEYYNEIFDFMFRKEVDKDDN